MFLEVKKKGRGDTAEFKKKKKKTLKKKNLKDKKKKKNFFFLEFLFYFTKAFQ